MARPLIQDTTGSVEITGQMDVPSTMVVTGASTLNSTLAVNDNAALVQPVKTTGSPNAFTVTGGAHTTLTASTEASDVLFSLARTVQFAAGAITNQRAVYLTAPTYGFVSGSTITKAATLAISGAPVQGTNATLTATHALSIEAGSSIFSGAVFADAGVDRSTAATLSLGAGTLTNGVLICKTGVTTTVAGPLSLSQTLAVTGAATFNGAVTLGDAAADTITVTGSIAGSLVFTSGSNHTVSVAAAAATASGGRLTMTGGPGGTGSAGAPGGAGGNQSNVGGVGGAASAAQVGGTGGNGNYTAGPGGASSAAQIGGAGGAAAFLGGDGGDNTAGGGGNNGGTARLDSGAGTGAGTGAAVNVANTNATSLSLGRTGILTTNNGSFTATQAVIHSSTTALNGATTVAAAIAYTAVTPSVLALGSTNDYAGLDGKVFGRLSGNVAGSTVSGFANGTDGREIRLVNVGANTITITNQDAASAAANRIITATGASILMLADDCMILMYDATTQRWRQITGLA